MDTQKSLNDQLANYLKANPHQWIDAKHLARIAGAYAWRTRISNLRQHPYHMAIRNRLRRIPTGHPGHYCTASEYRYEGDTTP